MERDGQVLVIDPPFVFAVRPTVVNDSPYWEARVQGESPLPLPDPQTYRSSKATRGWAVSRAFCLQVLAPNPYDLEWQLVHQLWSWWDTFVVGNQQQLDPWQKAMGEHLRKRAKDQSE